VELIRKCSIHERRDRGAEVMVVVCDSVTVTVMTTVKNVTLVTVTTVTIVTLTHVMAAAMELCDWDRSG
jgi:hypothetical protein